MICHNILHFQTLPSMHFMVWIWYNPNYFNVLTLNIVKKAAIFAKYMQNGIPYILLWKYVAEM